MVTGPRKSRTRLLVIAVGVVVLGIPTIFGVFPELATGTIPVEANGGTAGMPLPVRLVTLAVWAAAALAASVVAYRADSTRDLIAGLTFDALKVHLEGEETAAAQQVLAAVIAPGAAGIPSSYGWSVFSADDEGHLIRRSPPLAGPPVTFDASAKFLGPSLKGEIVVTREALEEQTTPAQFSSLGTPHVLVAAPVRYEGSAPFAVLVGTSRTDDGFFDDATPDFEEHLELVSKLARLVGAVYVGRVGGKMQAR